MLVIYHTAFGNTLWIVLSCTSEAQVPVLRVEGSRLSGSPATQEVRQAG